MKVERIIPPAPAEYHFVCNREEAHTICWVLEEAYRNHVHAVDRDKWREWAERITEVIR